MYCRERGNNEATWRKRRMKEDGVKTGAGLKWRAVEGKQNPWRLKMEKHAACRCEAADSLRKPDETSKNHFSASIAKPCLTRVTLSSVKHKYNCEMWTLPVMKHSPNGTVRTVGHRGPLFLVRSNTQRAALCRGRGPLWDSNGRIIRQSVVFAAWMASSWLSYCSWMGA